MTSPVPIRRLYREPADRVVAGVAAGIAAHLGASVVLVRVAFVVLAAFNGLGALLYAAFWAVLPMPPHVRSSRRNVNQLFSFLALGVGMVLLVLMVQPSDGIQAVIGWLAAVALAGVGLALAPLLYRMFTQLSTEREARVREQERAELAAMVHDQVLHTLALIQRNAGDVKEVQRLARGQERTLRNWLYKPAASPTEKFGAALEEASAEVEDTFAIAVETVVVGDVDVDERVAAIVAAAREALVNAAKHAKVETVSLYAEVEPDCVSVFVRDRGVGFELTAVESDRHGVRGSILARMQRHGGKAEIRSTPGDGTEVRLSLPIDTEK